MELTYLLSLSSVLPFLNIALEMLKKQDKVHFCLPCSSIDIRLKPSSKLKIQPHTFHVTAPVTVKRRKKSGFLLMAHSFMIYFSTVPFLFLNVFFVSISPSLPASFQVQVFRGSVDDRRHAVGEQLHFLSAQRQGGARRQRQDELCGAGWRSPGATQRVHTGITTQGLTAASL